MDFQSERQAITVLSDIIVKSSVSLFNSTKFIYSLTDDDFYNCDIKDVFKIIFNNFYDVSPLEAMGLKINPQKCKAMSNPLYDKIMPLILYSFAARITSYNVCYTKLLRWLQWFFKFYKLSVFLKAFAYGFVIILCSP